MNKEAGLTLTEILIGFTVAFTVVGVGYFAYTKTQSPSESIVSDEILDESVPSSDDKEEFLLDSPGGKIPGATGDHTVTQTQSENPFKNTNTGPAPWQDYKNDTYGYSISIPPQFDSISEEGASTFFLIFNEAGTESNVFLELKGDILTREQIGQRLDEIKEDIDFAIGTEIKPGGVVLTKIKDSDRSNCGAQWRYESETRLSGKILANTNVLTSCINEGIGFLFRMETISEPNGGATNIELFDKYWSDYNKALGTLEFFEIS